MLQTSIVPQSIPTRPPHPAAQTVLHPGALPEPAPFIKWVGGKSKLIEQFTPFFPARFNTYHEPFVGGGAVFFALKPKDAVLSDINPRLVETWTVIRDRPEALIAELERLRVNHDPETYYAARTRFNARSAPTDVERAALFIYLNKTCYNGLYRENSRGDFNVPVGRYASPGIYDPANIIAVSVALRDVVIRNAPFSDVLDTAKPGDLVYFDPPYVPLSPTSSFTGYHSSGFDAELQVALARLFARLARMGVYAMLSNSDTPFVRELYQGFAIERISATRSINSRADARGTVGEVLVRNW